MSWTEQDLEEFASTPVDQASDDLITRWTEYLFSPAPRQANPGGWHDDAHDYDGDMPSMDSVRQALAEQQCEYLPVESELTVRDIGSKLHNLYHIMTGKKFDAPHLLKH